MNCKSCDDPMIPVHGQYHQRCKSCNTYEFPSDIEHGQIPIIPQGKTTEFQCPKCDIPMEVGLIHNNIQICFCNNCRGFVTPIESLGHLINDLRSDYGGPDDRPVPIDPDELEFVDNCPACWEPMEAHPYYGPGNVVLDTCNQCQLCWLDHGELDKIVRAPGPRPNANPVGNLESQMLREKFSAQAAKREFKLW